MKKLLLSISVIFLFGLYSLFQRKSSQNSSISAPISTPGIDLGGLLPSASTFPGGVYKDGVYTGGLVDAFYGNVQIQATVNNGKLTGVTFLQYPNDRPRSIAINSQAMPILKSEAIQVQNTNVDIVSGATDTSLAFIQSLASALSQAR
jgi:uncharacterized protein with FMN-binding domain